MSSRRCSAQAQTRGVSLIEALLALVVMSLGMLAVVGVQATLRSNGDLSRQRAEAVRLAQEDIENWRTFTSVTAVVNQVDFTDIITAGPEDVSPAGANAIYLRTRTVPADPPNLSPPLRTMSVAVQWTDRAGVAQRVQLFTAVARIAPAISASLSVPANGGPARLPLGRHVAIPRGAVSQTDGTSTFTPPQPQGADPVLLVFDSLTGLITKVCTTTNAVITCTTDKAQLVTGFVRAAIPPAYPNPLVIGDAAALDPQSTAGQLYDFLNGRSLELSVKYTSSSDPTTARTTSCFSDPLLANISTAIEYFCVVRLYAVDVQTPTWTGALEFGPTPAVVTDTAALNLVSDKLLRACRYKPAPASYTAVTGPLGNQNFLLIAAGKPAVPANPPAAAVPSVANSCPAAATAPHQPPPP